MDKAEPLEIEELNKFSRVLYETSYEKLKETDKGIVRKYILKRRRLF